MAKKGGQVQLQQELTTDEEWEKFIQKPGLLDWAGPCSAMQATLKKIKMEFAGDAISYAVAKADTISYLERFRMKCEPTWMFIVKGKMVNLMYGADAPKLTRLILSELKKEEAVKEGLSIRDARSISEMADEERVRYEVVKAIEDERIRIETEKRLQAIYERRLAVVTHVLLNIPNMGVIIVFPQAIPNEKTILSELWDPANLQIAGTERPKFTEEMIEELLYFTDFRFADIDLESLLEKQSLAYAIKPHDQDLFEGNIDDAVLSFVYGESKCPPGSPESPAQLLMEYVPIEKEAKEEPQPHSVTIMPSMPSITDIKVPSSTRQSKIAQSKTGFKSKEALNKSKEVVTKSKEFVTKSKDLVIKSKEMVKSQEKVSSRGPSKVKITSKQAVVSTTSVPEEPPEEKEETMEVTGLWAPPDSKTRALALKLLFPRIYDPIALPEPVPTPPHIAIAFDVLKRAEALNLMNDYPNDIMRFGFFTSDNPYGTELVAKTLAKYERHRAVSTITGERLVIQLSRKRSEPWCVFSQLNPTFMSHTPEEGEEQCKLFFPEGYDDEEEEISEVVKERRGKRTEEDELWGAETEEDGAERDEEGEEEEEEGEDEGDDDDLFAALGIPPPEG